MEARNSSASTLKKVGRVLGFSIILALIFVVLVWWIIRPYGLTKVEVSEEYWNLKVRMAEQYAEDTGDTYFVSFPEDVRLFRNDDGSYWAYYNKSLLHQNGGGESYRIVDEADQLIIDNEIT